MSVDFDIKTYMTPHFTPGFGATQGWKRPYELAYLNLGGTYDTVPELHQYISGQRFENGLRAPISRIEITKHLIQGSVAIIVVESKSDRDFFEISDNEHLTGGVHDGHMMPRMKFPYRTWEINLKGKDDADFPATPIFRGVRTRILANAIGDKKITAVQDKLIRWAVEFQSPERFALQDNQSVSVWYQRANKNKDTYHLSFDTNQHITFAAAINRIVAWMNTSRPSVDSPGLFSFASSSPPYNAAPYTNYLDAVTFTPPMKITDCEQSSTWEILTSLLNHMGAVEGLLKKYVPTCDVNRVIEVTQGGFDKTEPAYTDFTTHESIQNNEDKTLAIDFVKVRVAYTGTNDAEYWIKFTLQKWNGSGWDTVITRPSTGYEYVAYEPLNTHSFKDFVFEKQMAGRYKWTADLVTAGSFVISAYDSFAATAPTYSLLASNSETDVTQLRTFVMTRGMCRYYNMFTDGNTCPDYFAGQCPQQWGLYPDPITSTTVALTGTLTFTVGSPTVVGSGTSFTTELIVGNLIKPNYGTTYHEVQSIESNTSLTLTSAFFDDCVNTAFSQASVKSGSTASNEVVHPTYGLLSGAPLNFNGISNTGTWNTKCRLVSKKMYNCAVNTDSSIREPVNVHLEFVDGYTTNLVGKYLEYYDLNLDEPIIFRCFQQKHILQGRRLTTEIDGFRV